MGLVCDECSCNVIEANRPSGYFPVVVFMVRYRSLLLTDLPVSGVRTETLGEELVLCQDCQHEIVGKLRAIVYHATPANRQRIRTDAAHARLELDLRQYPGGRQ